MPEWAWRPMIELAQHAANKSTSEGQGNGLALSQPMVSVVIPVFNEIENVVSVLDELECVLDAKFASYEVIVVDDGSSDGTAALVRRLVAERPKLRAVFLRRNFGQTAAFDAGFRAASGAVIVTMDGDFQNDPHDIPQMVTRLNEGCDVVAGWRRRRKDAMLLRKFPSVVANWMIRKVTRVPIHDLGCSLRVYRREVTEELRLYGEMHRFISVLAFNMGARVEEVEVNHRPRRAGGSKYGVRRTIKVLLDLMTVLFFRRYQAKPIYVFGGLAIIMVFLSSVFSAIVLWEKYAEGVWVHRNPLFIVAVMCTLVGVQLLGTGLIAELVIRTYFESQGRRAYSIAGQAGFERH
jgi:glycosyltransferase involved in cell wall biosynthesis